MCGRAKIKLRVLIIFAKKIYLHVSSEITALRSLVFQIIEVVRFPIGYNCEIQIFVKNRKLKISKSPKQYFCQDHWEENSEKV